MIEDIIEENIMNWLSYRYNEKNHYNIMFIFYYRCHVYYNKKNITLEELTEFLLIELNLPRDLIFNNVNISILNPYNENSLINVINNLFFRYLEMPYNDIRGRSIIGKDFILDLFKKHSDDARSKISKYRNVDKKILYKYFLLNSLTDEFEIKINPPKTFDNISYPQNHEIMNLTWDESIIIYYNDFIKSNEKLIEKDLEKYICKNGLIDNIKILKRQYKTKNGIIDLLGIDENNVHVLIELKVTSKPRDLIWQIQLYENDLKDELKNIHFRTMVVSPKLDNSIKNMLPSNCEIVEFRKLKSKFIFKKVR